MKLTPNFVGFQYQNQVIKTRVSIIDVDIREI